MFKKCTKCPELHDRPHAYCIACYRTYMSERKYRIRNKIFLPPPTHCKWGHEWTDANARVVEGVRKCRQCERDRRVRKAKAEREWLATRRRDRAALAAAARLTAAVKGSSRA